MTVSLNGYWRASRKPCSVRMEELEEKKEGGGERIEELKELGIDILGLVVSQAESREI